MKLTTWENERFWKRIEKTDTCWLWTGPIEKNGYVRIMIRAKRYLIHRLAYELIIKEIPQGLVIDHLCRVRHCVNPDHLEAVTQKENNYRIPNYRGNWIHCKRGHLLEERNNLGRRFCRVCTRKRQREFQRFKRATMKSMS